MFETLFGSEMPLPARFFIAFVVVLILIGFTAWLVRRFAANRLGGAAARGRQPRLAVIDAATVDGRRRLVLIRRDNVEHLLMIGGPSDVVIEPNIVRAAASRVGPGIEPAPRAEGSWPLQPANEPAPAPTPAPRAYRSTATEEPWHAPEPSARPRPAEVAPSAAAASIAAAPEIAPRTPEPPRVSIAPSAPEPVAAPQTDHNLAEMALQLEAALRRTSGPESRPPVTDPLAAAPAKPVPVRSPSRDFKPRIEPKLEPAAEPKFDDKPEAKVEPLFEPKFEFKQDIKPAEPKVDEKPTPGKSLYDNLEEEMASLLGRPSGKP